ncbi:hypothetical protein KAS33_04105 [bacterium]|nr:hypothetical protein [bacterium]
MCGFVGVYNYGNSQDIDEKLLVDMWDTMIHRGPDDCGVYLSPDRKLGLGHQRLSIIDLGLTPPIRADQVNTPTG